MPPPHTTEQLPTGNGAPTTHDCGNGVEVLVGHACVLHATDDAYVDGSGHDAPPFDAGVNTLCIINCTPPPHVTEQRPTAAGALITHA
jgi:hypothetical protein